MRQLTSSPRRAKESQKYGPRGWVDICRARAIQVYMFGVIVVGVVLRIGGIPGVLAPAVIVLLLLFLAAMVRLIAARREGIRWRSRPSPDASMGSS